MCALCFLSCLFSLDALRLREKRRKPYNNPGARNSSNNHVTLNQQQNRLDLDENEKKSMVTEEDFFARTFSKAYKTVVGKEDVDFHSVFGTGCVWQICP